MPFLQAPAGGSTDTNAPAPMVGGGNLRIEYGQLDAAINLFRTALDRLEAPVRQAAQSIQPPPLAADQVSSDAATVFSRSAQPATAAWVGAVNEIQGVIRQLEAVRDAVQNADDTSASQFPAQA